MKSSAAGLYLVTLRKRQGLNQEDVAGAVRRDVRTIARWERGENRPSIDAVQALMARLSGSVEEFTRLWDLGDNATAADAEAAADRALSAGTQAIVSEEVERYLAPLTAEEIARAVTIAQELATEDREQWLQMGDRLRRGRRGGASGG